MMGLTSGGGGMTVVDGDDSDLGLRKNQVQNQGVMLVDTYDETSSDLGEILSSSFSLITLKH